MKSEDVCKEGGCLVVVRFEESGSRSCRVVIGDGGNSVLSCKEGGKEGESYRRKRTGKKKRKRG